MLGLEVGADPDSTTDAPGQAPEEPRAPTELGAPDVKAEGADGGSEDKMHGGARVAEKEGGEKRDVTAQRTQELPLQSGPVQTFNDGTPRIYTSAPEAIIAAESDQ